MLTISGLSEILAVKMLLMVKCVISLLLLFAMPDVVLAGGGGELVRLVTTTENKPTLNEGVEVIVTPESTSIVSGESTDKLKYWPWALLLLAISYTGYQWLQEKKK